MCHVGVRDGVGTAEGTERTRWVLVGCHDDGKSGLELWARLNQEALMGRGAVFN